MGKLRGKPGSGEKKNSTETGIMFDRYHVVNLELSEIEPKGISISEERGVYSSRSEDKCESEREVITLHDCFRGAPQSDISTIASAVLCDQ